MMQALRPLVWTRLLLTVKLSLLALCTVLFLWMAWVHTALLQASTSAHSTALLSHFHLPRSTVEINNILQLDAFVDSISEHRRRQKLRSSLRQRWLRQHRQKEQPSKLLRSPFRTVSRFITRHRQPESPRSPPTRSLAEEQRPSSDSESDGSVALTSPGRQNDDRPTRNACLPSLLVIGCQKGGTTSWHVYMKNGYHPDLLVPQGRKELNYFSEHMDKGDVPFADYLADFPAIPFAHDSTCLSSTILAEASPNYLPHPFAAQRAHQHLPDAKILVLLRDPIRRLLSAFNMKWQERMCGAQAWKMPDCFHALVNATVTLEMLQQRWVAELRDLVETEMSTLQRCHEHAKTKSEDDSTVAFDQRVVDCLGLTSMRPLPLWTHLEDRSTLFRSVYVDQLARWLRHYPPTSFLVWSSEEFEQHIPQHLQHMVTWLGLDPTKTNFAAAALADKHHQRAYITNVPPDLLDSLRAFFRPHNERLWDVLREHGHQESVEILQRHFQ